MNLIQNIIRSKQPLVRYYKHAANTIRTVSEVPRLNRRDFGKTLAAMFVAGGGCIPYARYFEPNWLEVTDTAIKTSRGWKKAVKILFLSDLHLSDHVPLSHIEHAFQLGLAEGPDLIFLGGDYITHTLRHEDEYRLVLKSLSTRAPTMAMLGNHDGGPWAAQMGGYDSPQKVIDLLQSAGITCLRNAHVRLMVHDNALNLVAVGDEWSNDVDPQRAFSGISSDDYTVLLCHNPDSKEKIKDYPWHLMLCGHTHGGQLVVPITGATPFAPVRDKNFVSGLRPFENRLIYTSRGVGNVHGVRFNCRPEVTILRLN